MDERRSDSGRIDVLGPLRACADGVEIAMPAGHQGALLRALLLRPNEVLSVASLIELIWPGADHATGQRRLRVTASRLRSRLPSGIVLDAAGGGYRLTASTTAIDRLEFEALAERAGQGNPDAARRALDLWRGEPYLDFPSTPPLRRERRRLRGIRSRLEALTIGDDRSSPSTLQRSSHPARHPLDGAIERPRIQAQLPAAGSCRLLALVAPAGYGKTTLLEQWADRQDHDVAWIPVSDAGMSGRAFRQILGSNVECAADVGSSESSSHHDWSIGEVVNLLLRIERPVGVVIDDLHLITDEQAQAAVDEFVRLCPPNATVAIGSREPLPFRTSRLSAAEQTTILGADELAFTVGELDRLFELGDHAASATAPSRQRREWLHSVTGGWPEPSIAIAAAVNSDAALSPEEAVRGYVAASDLAERVLADLPGPLAHLLVTTAHLDPLHPDLCGTVATRDDARAGFELAVRHQLVSREHDRYRHRPPMGRLLRSHRRRGTFARTAGDVAAGRWYLRHGRPDQALRHGTAAGDSALVAASLQPAVKRAAALANGGALLRGASMIAIPPLVSDAARQTAILAAGFLPRRDRGHWAPEQHPRAPDELVLAIEALDLLRAGRCTESLHAVARGRSRLGRVGTDHLSQTIEALLAVTEYECLLMLGHPDVDDYRASIPRHADSASWPWLTIWSYGQRALHAWASGDVAFARALLRHARHRVGRVHPSWLLGAHGSATVTSAILGLEQDLPAEQMQHGVQEVESLLSLSHRRGQGPIEVIARYALHSAHRRHGDEAAAADALQEADAVLENLPGLPLVETARTRLLEVPATVDGKPSVRLSSREQTVVHHLDSDLTSAQIAELLHISVHTLKTHTRSIYRKLGVSSRAEAVARQRTE